MKTSSRFCATIIFLSVAFFNETVAAEEPRGVPPLKVVYFTPKDREGLENPEDRQERLGRNLKNIQDFYRKGMEENGYGPLTFALEWDAPGKLKVYDVTGKDNLFGYPKGTERKVYEEVGRVLHSQGIDMNREYVLILGAFVEWKDDKTAVEYGPYAGTGDFFRGVAWACDDHLIDSNLLASKDAGAFHYMLGHCSLGMYNTLYLGGIAHELGHCFGVPHDCERASQRETQGYSLMGIGNHHYGKELRNEGAGAFMTESTALWLSTCRAFNPELMNQMQKRENKQLHISNISYDNDKLTFEGTVTGTPKTLGLIVYNDNQNKRSDYDAVTWVSKPDEQGHFRFEITELEKVPYEMRFVQILPGESQSIEFEYTNETQPPTVGSAFLATLGKIAINQALDEKNYDKIVVVLKELAEKDSQNAATWNRKIKHLETVQSPPEFYEVSQLPPEQKIADLTWAKADQEKVGWYEPSRAILRECGFMEVNGKFFESGIYAHVDAKHTFDLDKKWKNFRVTCGIQDGKPGSVVFVVRCDGKEIFRSHTLRSKELLEKQFSVEGVKTLELLTENAGDGWPTIGRFGSTRFWNDKTQILFIYHPWTPIFPCQTKSIKRNRSTRTLPRRRLAIITD